MAGRRYSLTLEYFENSGSPFAQLAWSSPSTIKSIIPQSQLYPTFAPSFVTGASAFTAGDFQTVLFGLPGKDYVLQATTNLMRWTSISTNFSPVNPAITLPASLFNFTDSPPTNFPYRFYRAFQLP